MVFQRNKKRCLAKLEDKKSIYKHALVCGFDRVVAIETGGAVIAGLADRTEHAFHTQVVQGIKAQQARQVFFGVLCGHQFTMRGKTDAIITGMAHRRATYPEIHNTGPVFTEFAHAGSYRGSAYNRIIDDTNVFAVDD